MANLPLTEPQEEFAFHDAPRPAMVAGLGSGKTFAGTVRLILLMLGNPGINTAYYMPTYDLLKLRVWPGVLELLDQLGYSYKENKSEYTVTIHGYGKMILRSFDKPQRIVAYEVAHSIVDELDTLNKEAAGFVWRKISERNRQIAGGTIGLVTTPDQGYSGFVYQKWGKNPQPGYSCIHASTYSNPKISDDYIEQIKANYDPILADMFLSGKFVSLTRDKVYHFFDRNKHHTNRIITDQDNRLHVGLDFNVGGCCATTFIEEENNPIAVDEFVSYDTQDFCHNVKSRYGSRKVTVYPDASGNSRSTNASASDLAIIQNNGILIDAPKSNPFIRDRVNTANGLFSHDRIKVNIDKCPELTDALENQGYDSKGDPEKFNNHPAIDDWVDSATYYLNKRFSLNSLTGMRGVR